MRAIWIEFFKLEKVQILLKTILSYLLKCLKVNKNGSILCVDVFDDVVNNWPLCCCICNVKIGGRRLIVPHNENRVEQNYKIIKR